MSVVCFSLLLFLELIQQAALVNFMLFSNILKILKISFWTFPRKNWLSLDLWALFSLKSCKALRIAQCKHPRLEKTCLNSDLYFISKTIGTALTEIIVSYKPLSSLLNICLHLFQSCLYPVYQNQCPHFLLSPRFEKLS